MQIVAGTPPGGGLDRVARALAKAIAEGRLLDVAVEVVNVPGDGARRAWTQVVDKHEGDGHVVAISSPNLTSDYLVGLANFEHSKYSAVATLVTEYIAFAVRADLALHSGGDLLERLRRDAAAVTVALSTALGNPNHVALARLTRRRRRRRQRAWRSGCSTARSTPSPTWSPAKRRSAPSPRRACWRNSAAGRLRVLAIYGAGAARRAASAQTPTWQGDWASTA